MHCNISKSKVVNKMQNNSKLTIQSRGSTHGKYSLPNILQTTICFHCSNSNLELMQIVFKWYSLNELKLILESIQRSSSWSR